MTFKLGIVVGHTATSAGAKGIDLPPEYHYHREVADRMADHAKQAYGSTAARPMQVKIFLRDGIKVQGAYRAVDQWVGSDPAATVELHYNAATPSAHGTETLSSGSSGSRALANRVQSGLVALLGTRDRGIRIRNRSNRGRGWLNLVAGRPPAVITEPAFGSNAVDAALLRDRRFEIGRMIVDQAHAYFLEHAGG
jgi:N-acetylmuramoyl-L-alanine amidase